MFRLVWRSAGGRFGRILLTALAIIASTAFLGGTLVFDATVGRAFDAIISRTRARGIISAPTLAYLLNIST